MPTTCSGVTIVGRARNADLRPVFAAHQRGQKMNERNRLMMTRAILKLFLDKPRDYTTRELADHVGTDTDTVNELMEELEAEGVVRYGGDIEAN
jgi:predicted transcriptional regulator